MRVLGIDPGLTRCGVGIVDVSRDRHATLVHVTVLRTPPDDALERRLLALGDGLEALLDEHRPDAVAIERVFAQNNVSTVMGIAQISGVALVAAARRGLPVGMHTPSEVKAAVTGYGAADKRQVTAMIQRVLRLDAPPRPADAADALALAVCHAWRAPLTPSSGSAGAGADGAAGGTAAQRAWRAAEAASRTPVRASRLTR
ncbi:MULTISPECIES: crossover junction endodeoxyribonuclease RuvC [unclassified Rathayibacter]|jgi:crossover junction endodeoxyribonuclease RuvC|uniref:crossover junction endodeoxyribonuclease RuvC n=1 Tax=unclassified Rathayibacter TaxID=2609250 RepID=UPI000CE88C9F|nr:MULTISPECIES: crossover junction endodeoxyribonuclease RuvC [unclassified Rathayibacter]PPF16574.1 crossover junction endodeoxyribonuclease RuvC [Rathayibacter sp. AY1A7]PPF44018.1 crossover junction endodeoxyribonuclease RuvC [Rathayibacter sp. AY1A1]PPG83577.1 crossover junction endodeoxyribonuclease RuvC [Rathayibacter sp. AY1H2]PPG97542.1 crossover junction endodeoxyribonuclease RuvC [Rathayibacter sp. AY1G9]PPH00476.1 crossover junction endodeoxyribonuclease RuvC [Rathayibacter sp. AY1